ncbi:sigma-54-dependent transcriptional regulator [Desulfurivibrio alkaliphilus]|uniref:Two component, sigma54 specific, transcriptional regulator, Fis family n=1 Tax=Desulfurivibrio alkaliphilus (strain DSM 19089 / UNIQEM U267 / AHT2) TaxID=589865 RepID=D6YZV6_DESAT|nr:sigma-54 dependent transcriptional regulator [Desulfurivibrio alkaliphilus]ADH85113.1 two component, sigma54 specific, transcriptional regulator, Fis family [Desulfurivibrio alkaliphilus AHT 2]
MKTRGRIFAVDDDELILTMLARALKNEGYEVNCQTSSEDVVANIARWHPDVIFLDIDIDDQMSGLDILQAVKGEGLSGEVVMLTADDSAESAIRAMKLGAADYFTKPFNIDEVKITTSKIIEAIRLREEVDYLRDRGRSPEKQFVGESPVILEILEKARKLAQAGAETILITGESGTGKEVLARQIHAWKEGLDEGGGGPFLAVNCTALPENLIESELFGYARGAFTDARSDKKGVFELAAGGTLLLDEIGDMRLDLQTKLLRVLEERKVRRLGGSVDLPVDTTVIATTNKDIKAAVDEGGFRGDLFFRLSTFRIHLPPLRERQGDALLLARFFLGFFAHKYMKKEIKGFSPAAEKAILQYSWPGNVRELRNVIEHCVVLENVAEVEPRHLHLDDAAKAGRPQVERRKNAAIILPESGISLEEVEKTLIRQALERTNNNQTQAARLLQVSYDTLRYQVKKYGLL